MRSALCGAWPSLPPRYARSPLRDFLDSQIGAQRFLRRAYASPPEDKDILAACATFIFHFDDSAERASRFVAAVLRRQSRSPALAWLANLKDRLEAPLVEKLAEQTLAAIPETRDATEVNNLYWAGGLLARHLGSPWSLRTAQRSLADLERRSRSSEFLSKEAEGAGPKLAEMAGDLAGDEATVLTDQLMAALERPTSYTPYGGSNEEESTFLLISTGRNRSESTCPS